MQAFLKHIATALSTSVQIAKISSSSVEVALPIYHNQRVHHCTEPKVPPKPFSPTHASLNVTVQSTEKSSFKIGGKGLQVRVRNHSVVGVWSRSTSGHAKNLYHGQSMHAARHASPQCVQKEQHPPRSEIGCCTRSTREDFMHEIRSTRLTFSCPLTGFQIVS